MFRLLHPIPEAQDQLGGMSRSTLYEKIANGEINSVKVGRRTYITHDELVRFVQALTETEKQEGLENSAPTGLRAGAPLARVPLPRRKESSAKVGGTEPEAGQGR
jgi:excisionase family DNA binding protein